MVGNIQNIKQTYSFHSSNWSAISLLPKLTILAFEYLDLKLKRIVSKRHKMQPSLEYKYDIYEQNTGISTSSEAKRCNTPCN
jgi:hypothetical protein